MTYVRLVRLTSCSSYVLFVTSLVSAMYIYIYTVCNVCFLSNEWMGVVRVSSGCGPGVRVWSGCGPGVRVGDRDLPCRAEITSQQPFNR